MKRMTTPLVVTTLALLTSVTAAHAEKADGLANLRSSASEVLQITAGQAAVLGRADATPPNAMQGSKPGDTRLMAQMMQMQPQGQPSMGGGMQRGMAPMQPQGTPGASSAMPGGATGMPPQGGPGTGSAMPGGAMPMPPQGTPGAMGDDAGRMGAMPPQGTPGSAGAMPGAAMPMPAPGSPGAGPTMQGGMPMMQMMQMMPMMQMMMQRQAPAALDRVNGSIAFFKAELAITEAQSPAWDQFALALRTGREHQAEARLALATSAAGQNGAPDRLKAYESHLSMRLDSLRLARESFQRLYLMLTPVQKQQADELVVPLLVSF